MNAPETHPNALPAAEAPCEGCGKPFARRRRWQRFCSDKCRSDWHRKDAQPVSERLAELEQRVRELEAMVWPLGK